MDGGASHIISFAGREGKDFEQPSFVYTGLLCWNEGDIILGFHISKTPRGFGRVCPGRALGSDDGWVAVG